MTTKTAETTDSRPLQRQISRALRLTEKLEELDAQRAEVLAELGKILRGDATIGDLTKQAFAIYSDLWQLRYGKGYAFAYDKETPTMKRLVKLLGIEELGARMGRFLASHDPFFVKASHGFNVFVATVNQHAVASNDLGLLDGMDEPAPADCRHTPPCVSESSHTAALISERRAWQQ